jgi:hypothetical protein
MILVVVDPLLSQASELILPLPLKLPGDEVPHGVALACVGEKTAAEGVEVLKVIAFHLESPEP